MPIYYRSDTRSPEEIFENGFLPRIDLQKDWWVHALRLDEQHDDKTRRKSIDVAQHSCICLTSKLESAALFPFGNTKLTYIYAISLPPAIKVEYEKNNIEFNLELTRNSSGSDSPVVIDMHSLQTAQAGKIVNECINNSEYTKRLLDYEEKKDSYSKFYDPRFYGNRFTPNIGVYAGWTLYAYEAITDKVPPQNIMFAIKCERDKQELWRTATLFEFSLTYDTKLTPYRNFTLVGDIAENKNFNPSVNFLDDKSDHTEALKLVNEIRDNPNLTTPNIYYGLGGKTF